MKTKIFVTILLSIFLAACTPVATPTELPISTLTPFPPTATILPTNTPTVTFTFIPPTATDIPTLTPSPTRTPRPTQPPFDLSTIIFPLSTDDVRYFRANFDCETTYGDYTHDGYDIPVVLDRKVAVYAVASGTIQSNWVNDSVKYEVRLDVGKDIDGERLSFYFIHLDEIVDNPNNVNQGDIIGYFDGTDHLHFELRRGTQPRYESPSDGMQGDEVDITDFMLNFVREIGIPENKIIIGCVSPY